MRKKTGLFLYITAFICTSILFTPAGLSAAQVFVIIYHTFLGNERVATDFSVEELKEQVDALRQKGFRFVGMADLAGGKITGSNNILLCIDDGNASLYRAYREVLKPRNIRPLLAIYPNIIGKKKYALTWGRLRELATDGCDIAAHGFFHLHVNDKLYKSNKQYFHDEIYKSKRVLEDKLGRRITVFVYPSGEKCDRAEREIKAAGYGCAFTINWGTVTVPLRDNKNPYALPRYMLVRENWKSVFARLEKKSGTVGGKPVIYERKNFVRKPNKPGPRV